MAMPESADAVIATADTQTTNVETFVTDVMALGQSVNVVSIRTVNAEYGPDPDWVDPGDGSEAPQVPTLVDVAVTAVAAGRYTAAAAEKMIEVREALGL